MGHDSAEVEVGEGPKEGAGGGGAPIGRVKGRGRGKNVPPTKVATEAVNLLEANGQGREMAPDRVMETHKV